MLKVPAQQQNRLRNIKAKGSNHGLELGHINDLKSQLKMMNKDQPKDDDSMFSFKTAYNALILQNPMDNFASKAIDTLQTGIGRISSLQSNTQSDPLQKKLTIENLQTKLASQIDELKTDTSNDIKQAHDSLQNWLTDLLSSNPPEQNSNKIEEIVKFLKKSNLKNQGNIIRQSTKEFQDELDCLQTELNQSKIKIEEQTDYNKSIGKLLAEANGKIDILYTEKKKLSAAKDSNKNMKIKINELKGNIRNTRGETIGFITNALEDQKNMRRAKVLDESAKQARKLGANFKAYTVKISREVLLDLNDAPDSDIDDNTHKRVLDDLNIETQVKKVDVGTQISITVKSDETEQDKEQLEYSSLSAKTKEIFTEYLKKQVNEYVSESPDNKPKFNSHFKEGVTDDHNTDSKAHPNIDWSELVSKNEVTEQKDGTLVIEKRGGDYSQDQYIKFLKDQIEEQNTLVENQQNKYQELLEDKANEIDEIITGKNVEFAEQLTRKNTEVNELFNEYNDLNDLLNQKNMEIEDQINQINNHSDELAKAERVIHNLDQSIIKVKGSLETLTKSYQDNKLLLENVTNKLEIELLKKHELTSDFESKLKQKDILINQLKQSISMLEGETEKDDSVNFENQLNSFKNDLKDKENLIVELEGNIGKLQQRMRLDKDLTEQNKTELESQLKEAKGIINQYCSDMNGLKTLVSNLTGEKANLSGYVNQLEDEIKRSKDIRSKLDESNLILAKVTYFQ